MDYSTAMAQLRQEQDLDSYQDEQNPNWDISREVMGAISEGFGSRVDFGTFDNCREWGLTVTAGDWTFCTYEHRNGDTIEIQGCPTDQVQPFGPWGDADDSYDTLSRSRCGQFQEATAVLARLIEAAISGGIPGRAEAKAIATR